MKNKRKGFIDIPLIVFIIIIIFISYDLSRKTYAVTCEMGRQTNDMENKLGGENYIRPVCNELDILLRHTDLMGVTKYNHNIKYDYDKEKWININ